MGNPVSSPSPRIHAKGISRWPALKFDRWESDFSTELDNLPFAELQLFLPQGWSR
jgi:hypothetical protein